MAKESGEQYAIFVGGEKANGESNSLRGIITLTPDAEEGAEIRRMVGGEWTTTHERRAQVWEAVDPKGETVEEFETRQASPDKVKKHFPPDEAPPWEPDPFADPEDAPEEVRYVIERWGDVGDSLVIEGKVTLLTVTWELKRGEYNSDTTRGHVRLEPDNLKCDFVVPKFQAEVMARSGDAGIVAHVFDRLSGQFSQAVRKTVVDHMEQVHAVKPDVEPRRGGVSMGKEVRPTTKTTGTEL